MPTNNNVKVIKLVKASDFVTLNSLEQTIVHTFKGKVNGKNTAFTVEIPIPNSLDGCIEHWGQEVVFGLFKKQVRTLIRNSIAQLDLTDSNEKKIKEVVKLNWSTYMPVHFEDKKAPTVQQEYFRKLSVEEMQAMIDKKKSESE